MNEQITARAFPNIRWPAVVAGVAMALAIQVALGLFSLAFGLGAVPSDSTGLGALAIIWSLLVSLFAAGAGALTAVRMSADSSQKSTILHGTVVWAIGLILGALFITGSLASTALTAATAAPPGPRLLPFAARPANEPRRERIVRDEEAEHAAKTLATSAGLAGLASIFGLFGALIGAELGRRQLEGRPIFSRRSSARHPSEPSRGYPSLPVAQ